jgi:hypothetical protein
MDMNKYLVLCLAMILSQTLFDKTRCIRIHTLEKGLVCPSQAFYPIHNV